MMNSLITKLIFILIFKLLIAKSRIDLPILRKTVYFRCSGKLTHIGATTKKILIRRKKRAHGSKLKGKKGEKNRG